MPYIPPKVVEKAREMDLLTYLKSYDLQEFVHFGGNTYCTREHDSLKISNGKWCWFSRGIGTANPTMLICAVLARTSHYQAKRKEQRTMKPYEVTITETLQKTVEVEANSREEAERQVEGNWNNSEYIFDADSFVGVDSFARTNERNRDYER